MTHAIRMDHTGGPDVMQWRETAVGDPSAGQVRIRHTAVGVNYIDVYHRSGIYPMALPATPGLEGVGVVTAVGAGVQGLKAGDRVVYAGGPPGAYCEERLIDATRVIVLPDAIADETAAAALFSGLTGHFLLRQVYPLKAGDVVLIHAAAGKVGLLMCQWAHHLGATVIGTVGSDDKAAMAAAHGCDHPIVYTRERVSEAVLRASGGSKVHVVYDSVGKDTFEDSLDCLRPKGMLVSFGVASGETPPLDLRLLLAKGSLFVTRPSFGHYMGEPSAYRQAAGEVINLVLSGVLKAPIGQRFALQDAVAAHRSLEGRRTTGATVLVR